MTRVSRYPKPASPMTSAPIPRMVPIRKSRYRTPDAPTTIFASMNGAGTLRSTNTASVPLRSSA